MNTTTDHPPSSFPAGEPKPDRVDSGPASDAGDPPAPVAAGPGSAPVPAAPLMMLTVGEVVTRYRPWADPPETWYEHGRRLWAEDPEFMDGLLAHMRWLDAWFERPVYVHDGFVQDAHHRLVTAMALGWWDRPVPVQPITKPT